MSDFDRNVAAFPGTDRAVAVDAGLRAHMLRVYNYMAVGVGLTGLSAWFTNVYFGAQLAHSPIAYVLMFAPLILVFGLSFGIDRLSAPAARALFFAYAALLGASLWVIFAVYTQTSITQVFFVSAATFGALSLYGYTTQRDLSAFGSFLMMGLIGIVLASIVNIFLASGGLSWVISVIGVVVFAGLTAWNTQQIKEMYSPYDDGTIAGRKAVMGALQLYLDFINLFLMLLRLFGDRR